MSAPLTVLVLCTGNSARSILGEVLLNRHGEGRLRAFSAGSFHKGRVHPGALRLLERRGFDTAGLRSKSWDEFSRPGAPALDVILTVCDSAAGEVCPIWPGRPATAHWGLADPAAVEGDDDAVDHAFEATWSALERRVLDLVRLPLADLSPAERKAALTAIQDAARGAD